MSLRTGKAKHLPQYRLCLSNIHRFISDSEHYENPTK